MAAIHDLMHIYELGFEELSSSRIRNCHYSVVCKYCRHILVDSKLGKNQILENFIESQGKIEILNFVAPNYIRNANLGISYEKTYAYKKYLFYFAQFWDHKNHLNLIKAYNLIEDPKPELVLVGAPKNGYDRTITLINNLGTQGRVQILGYVSDEELMSLYRESPTVIFCPFCGPTNIPPIEAISLNLPLLCSSAHAMRDQCEDAALYFDPGSQVKIAAAISRLLNEKGPRDTSVSNILRVKKSFR